MGRWFIAIALSAFATAVAASPPARVEIAYRVLHNDSAVAEVTHLLEHDGKSYRLSERWEGIGMYGLLGQARRISRGRITPGGLRPLEYLDERSRRDTASARFDWERNTLTQEFRNGPLTQPIPAHAQDRLSLLFAPAFRAPGAEPIEFRSADGKGVSHYVFDVAGRERLRVPAGEFDALRLVKRKDNAGDRGMELWLDPAHSYLPLRLLVVQKDGTRIDQVAVRITMGQ